MNPEIKRLLKLSNIPGFKLNNKEQEMLDAWKKSQKDIKPVKKIKKAPKGYHYDEQIGTASGPTLMNETTPEVIVDETKVEEIAEENKIVKNIVKTEDKEIGKIEES